LRTLKGAATKNERAALCYLVEILTNSVFEEKQSSLAALVGKWEDFEEIADKIEEAIESRQLEGDGRVVSL